MVRFGGVHYGTRWTSWFRGDFTAGLTKSIDGGRCCREKGGSFLVEVLKWEMLFAGNFLKAGACV